MDPIVIVGAGLAAWTAAREFRKLDPATPVMMLTADSGDFYAKPSLSNAFVQGRTPEQLVTTPLAKMSETHKVQVLAATRVRAIDRAARVVHTGQGALPYRHLVLATGAQPIRVPLSGDAAERGILVDAGLQTSDPHVFALGDAAQYGTGRWADKPLTGGRTMPYVMPIMGAAKALAATLAGTPTERVFPLMPVTIKTPALPMVVAAAEPGTEALWRATEPGLWQQVDALGRIRGFVLAGKQTGRRVEQARLVTA